MQRKSSGSRDNAGLRNPNRRLDEDAVRAIYARCQAGDADTVIARDNDLQPTAVRNIRLGLSWQSLGLPPLPTSYVVPRRAVVAPLRVLTCVTCTRSFQAARQPGMVPRYCDECRAAQQAAAANLEDMTAKGRRVTVRGEGSKPRLKETDVLAIRAAHAAGATQVALAASYKVTQVTISYIVHRVTWQDI